MTSHLNSLVRPRTEHKRAPRRRCLSCQMLSSILSLGLMANSWAEIPESSLNSPSLASQGSAELKPEHKMVEIPLAIPPLDTVPVDSTPPAAATAAGSQPNANSKAEAVPTLDNPASPPLPRLLPASTSAASPLPSADPGATADSARGEALPARAAPLSSASHAAEPEAITINLAEPPPPPLHVDITDPDNAYYIYPEDAPQADIELPAYAPTLKMNTAPTARSPLPTSDDGRFGFVLVATVKFDFNKAELKPETQRALDQVVEYISRHPDLQRVLLQGHTDEVGSHRFNYALSDRRVAAVQDYLVNHGVNPLLLQPAGRGKKQAIDEPWTHEGRGRNRRVEIYVIHPATASMFNRSQH